MKNRRDALATLEDLQRRRDIVLGLLNRTRTNLEELLEVVQRPDADPRALVTVQLLTFQGRVLVQVMERLADEAAQLSMNLNRPTIDTENIEVPETLPKNL